MEQPEIAAVAEEGIKLNPRPISSPKGTDSIAVGTAHGRDRNRRPTLQGLHFFVVLQPLQGWSNGGRQPGAVPPAIEFVPFGEKRIRRWTFDHTLKREAVKKWCRPLSFL